MARLIFSDWVVDSVSTGKFTDLSVVPLYLASMVRHWAGQLVWSQFAADSFIAAIFGAMTLLMVWRVVKSMWRVGRNMLEIVVVAPMGALAFVGAIVCGSVLWFIYALSKIDYPQEHAAVCQIVAIGAAAVANLFIKAGGIFLGTVPAA